MSQFCALHDEHAIRTYLYQNPLRHIYELGDLDPFFWPHTSWYGWVEGQTIQQLALLYIPGGAPVLLTHANERYGSHPAFVASLIDVLPKRFYAHLDAVTKELLGAHFVAEPHGAYQKMGLAERHLALRADCGAAQLLRVDDIPALEQLYAEAYPGNWFDARMVQTGCYVGLWEGNRLVASAGIHVVSQREAVAALGNVTSHPDVRGKGYARQVCARLIQHLDAQGIMHIGLNVAAANARAQHLYAGLGFVLVAEYHEVMWG
jgi:ribosomal protein S18 acetylase RimI-like enzyme